MYVDAAYCYRLSSVVCLSVCHSSEHCRNGWTDEMPFGLRTHVGPGNHVLHRGPDPPWEEAMLRGERPIVKYRDTLQWAVQNVNHLGCGLWWAKGSMCHMGGGTLSQPDEYNWTIHVRQQCAMINYFDHWSHLLSGLTSFYTDNIPSTHHHNRFMALFPGPPRWAGARRELRDFMVQGKINRGKRTNHPAGCHSIWTKQCPPPPSPHFLQAGCPSCRPTNSWRQLAHTFQR